jgi:hypothetical protein
MAASDEVSSCFLSGTRETSSLMITAEIRQSLGTKRTTKNTFPVFSYFLFAFSNSGFQSWSPTGKIHIWIFWLFYLVLANPSYTTLVMRRAFHQCIHLVSNKFLQIKDGIRSNEIRQLVWFGIKVFMYICIKYAWVFISALMVSLLSKQLTSRSLLRKRKEGMPPAKRRFIGTRFTATGSRIARQKV